MSERAGAANLRKPFEYVHVQWTIVFELIDDRFIAGGVKSADQRIVNPHPW